MDFFLRYLNFKSAVLLKSNEWWDHFMFVFGRAYIDFLLNFFLSFIIGFVSCFEIMDCIVFTIFLLSCISPFYFIIFKYFSPFCRYYGYTRFSVNLYAHVKLFKILNNALVNFWIVIFTITGYYSVFDVFAYMLNKNYREEADDLN